MSGRFSTSLYKKLSTRRFFGKHGETVSRFNGGEEEEIAFEVNLDPNDVAAMARKAASNKSQQCNAGPIQVRVLSRTKLEGGAQ